MTRGWTGRVLVSVVGLVVLYVVLSVLSFEPDLAGLLLMGAVVAASVWLVLDAIADLRPSWSLAAPTATSSLELDSRLAACIRLVEDHRTAATPDGALRDRLVALAEARLRERHGLAIDTHEGRALLGTELMSVIETPARRLGAGEIDRLVRRIEEL